MLKWSLIVVGGLAAIVILVVVVGALLPRDHIARSSVTFRAPVEEVWRTIADVAAAPTWRDVRKVEILSAPGEKLRWREESKFGPITYEQVESSPPHRLVGRIADTDQGFGGTWTYEIGQVAADSARVTIVENGFVSNPLFRFMSRYILGYYGTQEAYLRSLGKKFGQEVTPVRG